MRYTEINAIMNISGRCPSGFSEKIYVHFSSLMNRNDLQRVYDYTAYDGPDIVNMRNVSRMAFRDHIERVIKRHCNEKD